MTDEEFAARFAEMRVAMRLIADMLTTWIDRTSHALIRLWQRLVAWVQQQGILSPAYAYASPAMRRRAARERAHLAMRAKNRHI